MVAGEVVGGFLDLLACEVLRRPATTVGIEDLFPLPGESLLRLFNAALSLVDENANDGSQQSSN